MIQSVLSLALSLAIANFCPLQPPKVQPAADWTKSVTKSKQGLHAMQKYLRHADDIAKQLQTVKRRLEVRYGKGLPQAESLTSHTGTNPIRSVAANPEVAAQFHAELLRRQELAASYDREAKRLYGLGRLEEARRQLLLSNDQLPLDEHDLLAEIDLILGNYQEAFDVELPVGFLSDGSAPYLLSVASIRLGLTFPGQREYLVRHLDHAGTDTPKAREMAALVPQGNDAHTIEFLSWLAAYSNDWSGVGKRALLRAYQLDSENALVNYMMFRDPSVPGDKAKFYNTCWPLLPVDGALRATIDPPTPPDEQPSRP